VTTTDVTDPCAATPGNRIDFTQPGPGDGPSHASIRHDLLDLGENGYAQGEVTLNDAGDIASYTVAPGDSPFAIGDRFCIDCSARSNSPELHHALTASVRNASPSFWGSSAGCRLDEPSATGGGFDPCRCS
jgi:hypothetical protein